MENKYFLNIYPAAQKDMEQIFQYISVTLNSPQAAYNLIMEIQASLNLVCEQPHMCPLISNHYIKNKNIRKLIVRKYIIFYMPNDINKEIQVIRVLYGMTNYEKYL